MVKLGGTKQLTIENLSKSYGAKFAINKLNFSLRQGVYGLIGPNGAGKTTLLNIITGNIHPSSGRVMYKNQDVALMGHDFRQILGYTPQQQALYPDFTAERFMYYIAALRGLKKRDAVKQINWAIEQVDLTSHVYKRIGAMSGGMKQRLLIAQAILADPEVLILDEPTAGLDPNQRIAIRNLIGKLADERIIIISTHVVSDVEYIANEFLILRDGILLAQSDRNGLVEKLNGKVYEIETSTDEMESVMEHYLVSNVIHNGNIAKLRVISHEPPSSSGISKTPTLDDVCLFYFSGKYD